MTPSGQPRPVSLRRRLVARDPEGAAAHAKDATRPRPSGRRSPSVVRGLGYDAAGGLDARSLRGAGGWGGSARWTRPASRQRP